MTKIQKTNIMAVRSTPNESSTTTKSEKSEDSSGVKKESSFFGIGIVLPKMLDIKVYRETQWGNRLPGI